MTNEPHNPHEPHHSPDHDRSDDAQGSSRGVGDQAQAPAQLDHWSPVTEAMRQPNAPQVTGQGNPIDPPDPGTPLSRLVAIIVACVVVLLVVAWQNTPDATKEMLFYGKVTPPVALTADDPAPGNFGQVDLMGRLFLRGFELFKDQPVISMLDPSKADSKANSSGSGSSADDSKNSPAASKLINEDRVRLVMLGGEFEGTDSALRAIGELRSDLRAGPRTGGELDERDQMVMDELDALETLYRDGPEAISAEQQLRLGDRYGLIGKVALTHGLSDTDPRREPLISGFAPIAIFLLLAATVVVLGPLLGLIALILGSIYFATGRLSMRGHVPTPGGSVFLETYALFVGAFIVMAVGTFLVSHSSMPELAGFSLLVQWLLLLTVLWGLVRGMPARAWRHAIGWHTGEGVFKEIGCGIVGYLACLPLYIVGVLITVILLLLKEFLQTQSNGGVAPTPEPMTNPIFEMIAHGDLLLIMLLFVLATTWAPIVEEAIFRGALFRHFRGRVHWVFAALGSAVLFAFMHDYGPLMVAPLIALGFMFAFMREWRGSLIAPMTAHFLHNFTLMAGMIVFVQLIKDPM